MKQRERKFHQSILTRSHTFTSSFVVAFILKINRKNYTQKKNAIKRKKSLTIPKCNIFTNQNIVKFKNINKHPTQKP